MTRVFHRNPRDTYPVAVRGAGAYLIDRDGKRYLDASGGAAVSCLGHSDKAVVKAIQEQLAKLPFAHTSFFTNEPMEALADALVARAPAPLEKVYFVSGGSEAIEAALKLARQYFVEKGEPQRRYLIGRRQSYHGNTLGALAVGGNAWRRKQFEPLLVEATHVSPCYAYRGKRAGETETTYGERLAAELEAEIRRLGSDKVIAFVAETVVGATLGAVPPVAGYFKRVRQVCDRHGVLLILDEVMCGMGRCGARSMLSSRKASCRTWWRWRKGWARGTSRSGRRWLPSTSTTPLSPAAAFFSMAIPIWVTLPPAPVRSRCSNACTMTGCWRG